MERKQVTVTERVLSLMRADGTCHAETTEGMAAGGSFDGERASFGRLPKGWKWIERTSTRTGYEGKRGGFVQEGETVYS
jgi:hypothetical protein